MRAALKIVACPACTVVNRIFKDGAKCSMCSQPLPPFNEASLPIEGDLAKIYNDPLVAAEPVALANPAQAATLCTAFLEKARTCNQLKELAEGMLVITEKERLAHPHILFSSSKYLHKLEALLSESKMCPYPPRRATIIHEWDGARYQPPITNYPLYYFLINIPY